MSPTRRHRIEDFKLVATTYMAAEGVSAWTVSNRVFSDGQKLMAILERGADLTSRRLDRALWWFSENWPAGADWPKGVERP